MQRNLGISKISTKCSFEAMIVKHKFNLVDFQVRGIALSASTEAPSLTCDPFFVAFAGLYANDIGHCLEQFVGKSKFES